MFITITLQIKHVYSAIFLKNLHLPLLSFYQVIE